MNRDDSSLAIWERNALCAMAQREGEKTVHALVGAFETERLLRRAHFLLRSGLLPRLCSPQRVQVTIPSPSPHLEHRLFALFAE